VAIEVFVERLGIVSIAGEGINLIEKTIKGIIPSCPLRGLRVGKLSVLKGGGSVNE